MYVRHGVAVYTLYMLYRDRGPVRKVRKILEVANILRVFREASTTTNGDNEGKDNNQQESDMPRYRVYLAPMKKIRRYMLAGETANLCYFNKFFEFRMIQLYGLYST